MSSFVKAGLGNFLGFKEDLELGWKLGLAELGAGELLFDLHNAAE
jgi:hypothetical protein